jgi:hypothetical protein
MDEIKEKGISYKDFELNEINKNEKKELPEVNKKISKWQQVDEKCNLCGNITKRARGFSKQNLKRLFFSTSLEQIIIFFLLLFSLFAVYHITELGKEINSIYENPKEFCNKQNIVFIKDEQIGDDLVIPISENKVIIESNG